MYPGDLLNTGVPNLTTTKAFPNVSLFAPACAFFYKEEQFSKLPRGVVQGVNNGSIASAPVPRGGPVVYTILVILTSNSFSSTTSNCTQKPFFSKI